MTPNKKIMTLLTFLGIYFLVSGGSWAIFSYLKKSPGESSSQTTKKVEDSRRKIDTSAPKTEICPINGAMFTKAEREIWEKRRPMTAIIENHADSRPQSGLSRADVVYEAVAEGGITRFLSVFYCGASAEDVKIAPIRSIRVYFINWASEYSKNPVLVHSGGANNICNSCPGEIKPRGDVDPSVDAFKILAKLGWRAPNGNAMDAGTNLGFPAVKRDQYRLGTKSAWEHSFEGYTDKIFEVAEERGFGAKNENGSLWSEDFVKWEFADETPAATPAYTEISFEFWSNKPDYDVVWKYDKGRNAYLRVNGGKDHQDFNTKEQLAVKNLVIEFVKEKGPVDREGHMFYTNVGSGKALVFQNGEVIEATWSKASQFDRTVYKDSAKAEIKFVRGQIWIDAVPDGNKISY
ncbi:MAG: hypothetical protein US62_C0007G0033 [Candidatus Woesebacteria bacterium GW2011_GWA1_37_8]|uniref:DUF3048 domain-containing protein n=2 Tax=Candidatus Woeseibacteriota TaxID=1752722 RepID=A0A0G0L5I8_9BACT|nr:MAG: hypothetical protein US39_C0001G0116 [Microgenomates group bacterium GW2011_GWC1_37_12b]KKQ45958.1 MAG: hypothetical protein US62_C0007G0033 [Candidatus Woesebacteria bacterium GW2011_GWA1_37_8]KKQ87268.1 MAG: hypothetical protein UT10_C0008G0029 [Candidatus Woesebacteria bacterium GW2011_GWB1_38_8b]